MNLDEIVLNIFRFISNYQTVSIFFYFYFFFYFVLLLYIFYLYFFEKNYRKFKRFSILLILGFLIIYALKYSVKRERPENAIIKKEDYSFPSAHAYFSTLLFIFSSNFIGIFFKFYSIITIFSLLCLSLHFLTDIIFSVLLAILLNFLFQSNFLEKVKMLMKEIVGKLIRKRKRVEKKVKRE